MKYSEIAAINVNEHIEKKNNLSYLSWPFAVDQLLRLDNEASWSYGTPLNWNETVMVFCSVTAFGRTRTAQLPVMDYRNKAITKPDAFQVNTAMQRCLAKAISLHGLGLYIYAGEDTPPDDATPVAASPVTAAKEIVPPEAGEAEVVDFICELSNNFIAATETVDALREFWKTNKSQLERVKSFSKPRYNALEASFKQKAIDFITPKKEEA